jgi:hypothetical protein
MKRDMDLFLELLRQIEKGKTVFETVSTGASLGALSCYLRPSRALYSCRDVSGGPGDRASPRPPRPAGGTAMASAGTGFSLVVWDAQLTTDRVLIDDAGLWPDESPNSELCTDAAR